MIWHLLEEDKEASLQAWYAENKKQAVITGEKHKMKNL